MENKNLLELREGDRSVVKKLLSTGSMRQRLQDLGIIEGACISCVQKSPFGDPVAYEIRGAVIALRAEDAGNILVI